MYVHEYKVAYLYANENEKVEKFLWVTLLEFLMISSEKVYPS